MHHKNLLFSLCLALVLSLVLGLAPAAQAGYVNVEIYKSYTMPLGSPFSNYRTSFTTTAIDYGDFWFPLGDWVSFGAELTGALNVTISQNYGFNLTSDDGSALFIDNFLTPVINNGGEHPPTTVSANIFLSAGYHPFEVTFFENGIGNSTLRLSLPSGVSYGNPVPLPPAILLLGSGLLGLAGLKRKSRRG